MQKILAIFAHPDDEGMVAGTLAHYAQQGAEVTLVCGTRGEVGEISDPALATQETLGDVRQKELEDACAVLGVQNLEFLGWRDSGMAGTPENDDPRALVQVPEEQAIGKIVAILRHYQPDIVITFEPFGWYGHPDHQAISRWATAAFEQLIITTSQADDGAAWRPMRLFHSVLPFTKFRAMMEAAMAGGYLDEPGFSPDIPDEIVEKTETAVTHLIDIQHLLDTKRQSMLSHRTQFGPDNIFSKLPQELLSPVWGIEHFIQIYPKPDPALTADRQADLFANFGEQ